MQEAAKMGAYLELTFVRAGSDAAEAYVKAIRAVGPEFIVPCMKKSAMPVFRICPMTRPAYAEASS